jgi:type VI secretion system secreted protein VgrG
VGETSFDVDQLSGSEGISEIFALDLEATNADTDLDLDALLGADATLTLRWGDTERTLYAIVSEVAEVSILQDVATYALRLVPPAWLLTQQTDCRAFQNETSLDDLFAEVLGSIPYRLALVGSYTPRDLYVQYQESAWDFLSRIFEENGLFYFFEHVDGACKLVICDDTALLSTSVSDLPFVDENTNVTTRAERVVSFCSTQRLGPERMSTRTVSFDTPSKPSNASAGTMGTAGERYGYQLSQSAATRLAAQKVTAKSGTGTAYCVRLAAGTRFSLTDHPRSDLDGAYVITHLDHRISDLSEGSVYRVSFKAISSSTPYVSTASTPRPTIKGPQAAQVVSAAGEIDVDEHGRVLVRMSWDRIGTDDGSGSGYNAVRVPVAQMSSGTGYGAAFVPRAGTYVLVEFLDGDPEKPVITGRAFNTLAAYPYSLPANKTISTIRTRTTPYQSDNHCHELTFQDSYGSEETYLRAERQLRVEVKDSDGDDAQRTVTVYGNDTETVTGDQERAVVGARLTVVGSTLEDQSSDATNALIVTGDDSLTVYGDREVTIGTAGERAQSINTHAVTVYGDDALRVTSTRTVDVGGDKEPSEDVSTLTYAHSTKVRGNEKLSVSGSRTITVNGNQTLQVDGSLTENIEGTLYQTYGAIETTVLTGNTTYSTSTGNLTLEAVQGSTRIGGNTVYVAAESAIEIRSATSISLVVGSLTDNGTWYRKITLDEDGIYISNGEVTEKLSGSKVKINC